MARVLIVTPILKSQRGNSITATRLFNGLGRQGFTIDLLAMDQPDWQQQLDLCLRANKYDLVHGFHALHFYRAATHPVIRELPLLLTTTGTDINYDLTGPQAKQTLETLHRANKIVVFNPDLGRQIIIADARLEPRLTIIPQGVDLPAVPQVSREQLGLSETDTIFIMPSGLRPVKNLDLALDGLSLAQRSFAALSLLIMGSAIDTAYAHRIESRLEQFPWAHYLGEVPHQQIGGIMQAADVVINTSLAEGQPQGALEAMSLGKPGILSAVPGNLGIIEEGMEGYYINSAKELSEAALQLAREPSLRNAMGSAARNLVNKRYSAEKEIAAYARLYENLILNHQ